MDSELHSYKSLLETFVAESNRILDKNLVGIYLHGSAAMGCFNPNKSDLDLIVIVKHEPSNADKRSFMDMVVALNQHAPAKGIEMSMVRECFCNPFIYPTPYELHFSMMHLDWYQSNPDDYVEKMCGTDVDLAAHFTVIYHRGITLWGKEISDVFAQVPREDYLDSILSDVRDATDSMMDNPVYFTLNLCRVLAYKQDGLVLSKREGGEWGLDRISNPDYRGLIFAALQAYQTEEAMEFRQDIATSFASDMLKLLN